MQNYVNSNISWYEWHDYQRLGQKIKIFKILCTKYMASSEAMTSSTHSFAYSYGLVKKCFLKNCETSKFHNFLIFQPIFIRFSLFCSENFTLSSEIKLDQLRTSPLRLFSYPTTFIIIELLHCLRYNSNNLRSYSEIFKILHAVYMTFCTHFCWILYLSKFG